MHGQFIRLGAEQVPLDADEVSQVEQLVDFEVLFAHHVPPDVDLQPSGSGGQVRKAGLPVGADGHDAPGDAHVDFGAFEFLASGSLVAFDGLLDSVRGIEAVRVGRVAEAGEGFEFLLPLFVEGLRFGFRFGF